MKALSKTAVGQPLTKFGQTLYPLYSSEIPTDIRGGQRLSLQVSEVGGGTVGTLHVANAGEAFMLVPSGTVLKGGLQNRVVNSSVLIAAGESYDVPVSCVQQGRWSGQRTFERGSSVAPRSVRRRMQETTIPRHDGYSRADQGAVWAQVEMALNERGARNQTGDLTQIENSRVSDPRRAKIEKVAAGGPLPGQIGLAVMQGSRVVSIEMYASSALLADHWDQLIRSIFDEPAGRVSGRASADRVLRQLSKLSRTEWTRVPTVGIGQTHVAEDTKWSCRVLETNGAIVHASMFALAG